MKPYFKRKTYGYGWYPATWQGWLVLAVYLIVIGIITWSTIPETSAGHPAVFVIEIIIATVVLIGICYRTGERPRWQWGDNHKS